MLKRNFFLDPDQVVVGKKVYAKSRPDMVGIITDVQTIHPGAHGNSYGYFKVRVYYCRSKRTSKWLETNYKFCDFDAYFRECSSNYTQAELLTEALKQGEEALRKKNGNQAG